MMNTLFSVFREKTGDTEFAGRTSICALLRLVKAYGVWRVVVLAHLGVIGGDHLAFCLPVRVVKTDRIT